jgi:hypothetical protein
MDSDAKLPVANAADRAEAWRVELADLAHSIEWRVAHGESVAHWKARLDRAQAAHDRGESVEAWVASEDASGTAVFLY